MNGAPVQQPHAGPEAPAPARAGVGFKPVHLPELLARGPARFLDGAGFLEVHAENYLVDGGPMLRLLERARADWPLSVHGVGLSIGGEDPPDAGHLDRLDRLLRRFEPFVFSEHLAWSGHGGRWFGDLLPLAYDRTTLDRVCHHVDAVQTRLRRRLLLENPSTYLACAGSSLSEGAFLAEVVRRTGCGLLLDVCNAEVSGVNHGREAWDLIEALPRHAVALVHLAGFAEERDAAGAPLLIDHHGAAVDERVWALYGRCLARFGPVPTLVERDHHLPPLAELEAEAMCALALQRGLGPVDGRPVADPPALHDPETVPSTPLDLNGFGDALLDDAAPPPAGLFAWNGSDPLVRLGVHRRTVRQALTGALAETFSVVRQLVGEACFKAMAAEHARRQPPASPGLHAYGAGFADGIAGLEPTAALAYLPDVARLEWLRCRALHAADAVPIDHARLAERLGDPVLLAATGLGLHPSLAVLRSPHPVVSIWRAHQEDDEATRDSQLRALPPDRAEAALVFREASDTPAVVELAPAEAALVEALASGLPLGPARDAHPQADLVQALARLLGHGLVVGLHEARP